MFTGGAEMGLVRELVLGTLLIMVLLGSVILLLVAKLRHAEELRHREHEIQETMVKEMGHRLRNFVVTVQSLAFQSHMSVQRRDDIKDCCRKFVNEFYAEFDKKLVALGSSMAVVFRHADHGELKEVLLTTLRGFASPDRFEIMGRDLMLRSECVVALNLVIHELCTNAAKYGALSNTTGQVTLSWEVIDRNHREILIMDWVEEGGPPVVPPTRNGFGSLLINNLALGHLKGKTQVEYLPSGLICHIELPL